MVFTVVHVISRMFRQLFAWSVSITLFGLYDISSLQWERKMSPTLGSYRYHGSHLCLALTLAVVALQHWLKVDFAEKNPQSAELHNS